MDEDTETLLEEAALFLAGADLDEEVIAAIALLVLLLRKAAPDEVEDIQGCLRELLDDLTNEIMASGTALAYRMDPDFHHMLPGFDTRPLYQQADDYVEKGTGFDEWLSEHFDDLDGDDSDTTTEE